MFAVVSAAETGLRGELKRDADGTVGAERTPRCNFSICFRFRRSYARCFCCRVFVFVAGLRVLVFI